MNQLTAFNNFLNEQITSSPLYLRAQEMAKGRTPQELEQVARNICDQKGIKYDDAYKAFSQMLNK